MYKKNKIVWHRNALLLVSLITTACLSVNTAANEFEDLAYLPSIYSLLLNDPQGGIANTVDSDEQAVNFLLAASFGPTDDSVNELKKLGYSAWFKRQLALPINSLQDETNQRQINDDNPEDDDACLLHERFSREAWFKFAVTNEDQLRQRVAFALSQIFVVATQENVVRCKPLMQGHYMDVLQEGAFGNFRDLLEDVSYHTFMAIWLTYINNAKANPVTGSAPDENYAREIMQLFTIGLVELNMDGTPKLDNNGDEIESYTQEDVTELAKVFTGLHRAGEEFGSFNGFFNNPSDILRLEMDNDFHSPGPKVVLGHTIPEYSDGNRSISDALDILAEHPNTAPFIAKHLIQRLTTSNPSPSYVSAAAQAFKSGSFRLPDGSSIGSRQYGDLKATVAAVLFFEEARSDRRFENTDFGNHYGKVREPILRFTHWARVSDVTKFSLPWFSVDATVLGRLGQDLPLRARSVFNFFRPGYVEAGSETARANLVAPELQIEFGPNMIMYANAIRSFILRTPENSDAYYPNYEKFGLLERAATSQGIVDYYNLIYTGNRLHPETIESMIETLDTIHESDSALRLLVATIMITNTIEYKTQK